MTTSHRTMWRSPAVLTLAGASFLAALAARAQAPTGGDTGSRQTPQTLLADQLVLLSNKPISGQGEPTVQQLQAGAVLLDQALDLNPSDAELWRLRLEFAQRLGQEKDQLRALTRYCDLRPRDDAALLDLILRSIAPAQTVERRIAAAERLLDSPSADRLSAPLRSRLASYVAQASREVADQPRLARRLREAIALDSSNKQARQIVYDLAVAHAASAAELAEALGGILEADPLDAAARRRLADLLFLGGAYDRAATQYQAAQTIHGQAFDDEFYRNLVASLIAANRLDAALEILSALGARAGAGTTPPATTRTATTPSLPIDLEQLRLCIFHLEAQVESAEDSLALIRALLQPALDKADAQAAADLLWTQALLGPQPPDAESIARLRAQRGAEDPQVRRSAAWVLLRQGDVAARAALEALPPEDPFRAYGRARLAGGAKTDQGRALRRDVVKQAPGSVAAILAACELAAAGAQVPTTDAGVGVLRAADALPRAIRDADFVDRGWVRVDVKPSQYSYQYLQPVSLSITLRNSSGRPLALAPDGPVPSRMFVYLEPRSMGRTLSGLPPLVVDLRRQLVLEPGKPMTVEVRLDRSGGFGWLLSVSLALANNSFFGGPGDRIVFGGVAVLDPRSTGGGRVNWGPLGGSLTIDLMTREALPIHGANAERWLQALNDPDTLTQMQAAAWLAHMAARVPASPETQQTLDRIKSELTSRFSSGNNVAQAWTSRFILPDLQGGKLFPAIHETAQRSDDPLVRVVYLASQVDDPDSPAIDAALRHGNPLIADFARDWRATLVVAKTPATRPSPAASGSTPPPPR